jgi:hypothetical protein
MPPSARSLRRIFELPQCGHVTELLFAIELPSIGSSLTAFDTGQNAMDAP